MELDDYDGEGQAYEPGSFQVTDDAKAAWAMRKMRAVQVRIDEAARVASAERERIDEWAARVTGPLLEDRAYFEGLLIAYAVREREQGRKSIDLPHGSVRSRTVAASFEADGTDDFLEWAREHHPEWIRVKESFDMKAIKDATTVEPTGTLGPVVVTNDGEIIPGLIGKPSRVSYTIAVEGEKHVDE